MNIHLRFVRRIRILSLCGQTLDFLAVTHSLLIPYDTVTSDAVRVGLAANTQTFVWSFLCLASHITKS